MTTKIDNSVTIKDLIVKNENKIKTILPRHVEYERMMAIVLGAINNNPKLQKCDPISLFSAVLKGLKLGLEPNGPFGESYLIPYNNTCNLIIGYRGLISLAKRNNANCSIYAHEVRKNDDYQIYLGTNKELSHEINFFDRGPVIGYYAVYKADLVEDFEVMSLDDVNKIRDTSQSYIFAESGNPKNGGSQKDSVWHQYPIEQGKKTVIKRLSKRLPLSVQVMESIDIDNSDHKAEGPIIDVDGYDVTDVKNKSKISQYSKKNLPKRTEDDDTNKFRRLCHEIGKEKVTEYLNNEYKVTLIEACQDKKIVSVALKDPKGFTESVYAYHEMINGTTNLVST